MDRCGTLIPHSEMMELTDASNAKPQSLLGEPFRRRREILRERFAPMQSKDVRLAKWELIPSCTDNDPEKVKEFFDEVLKVSGCGSS